MTLRPALLVLGLGPVSAAAQQPGADSLVYLLTAASRLEVRTGKAGLLGFLGHEHLVRARAFTGRVVYYPESIGASRVEIVIPTDSLEVLTRADSGDLRDIRAAMRNAVLDVANHPEIRFVSRDVTRAASAERDSLRIVGTLTIRGRARAVTLDVGLEFRGDTLLAATSFAIRQTDFGIEPYSGGPLGTVRVADRVRFAIRAVALPYRAPAADAGETDR